MVCMALHTRSHDVLHKKWKILARKLGTGLEKVRIGHHLLSARLRRSKHEIAYVTFIQHGPLIHCHYHAKRFMDTLSPKGCITNMAKLKQSKGSMSDQPSSFPESLGIPQTVVRRLRLLAVDGIYGPIGVDLSILQVLADLGDEDHDLLS